MRFTKILAITLSLAPLSALAAGGTITGKVDATPPKFLGDTVVYLKEVPGKYEPKTLKMDQKGMTFVPHVLTVTVGDTVEFLNSDSVGHNVFSPDGGGYNLGTFNGGEKASHVFDKQGGFAQLCSVHPEMLGYIFAGQNPYSATVDKNGTFKIENVPAGSWKIDVWNPKLKAAEQTVKVEEGKPSTINFSIKR